MKQKSLSRSSKEFIKYKLSPQTVLSDRVPMILVEPEILPIIVDKVESQIESSTGKELSERKKEYITQTLLEELLRERDTGFRAGVDYTLTVLGVEPIFNASKVRSYL